MNTSSSPSATTAELLNRLHDELHAIAQANCSMGAAAKVIKPMEHEAGILCPELVIPLLVTTTSKSLATCFEIFEQLEARGMVDAS